MKHLLFILFPLAGLAQPKKGHLSGKQSSMAVNDSIVVWRREESFEGRFYIGEKTLTIKNTQYSIDSVKVHPADDRSFYTFFLSLRGKLFLCYVYPEGEKGNWKLLFDDRQSFVLYNLREE